MRNILRSVLAGTLLLAIGVATAGELCTAEPQAVAVSASRLARIDAAMQRYVDAGHAAGIVTWVARAGRVIQQGSYGMADVEAGVPMRPDTLFRLASMTKPVTSVAAMMLVEEGRLALEDPVSRYLPEFASPSVAVREVDGSVQLEPARRPLTVRDLLTHTSGISYGMDPAATWWQESGLGGGYLLHRAEPMSALVARIAALPLDAQPGEHFVYGYNTDVLGVLVEKVSGMSLDAFFRERIFDPLRMHDTFFYVPPAQADRLAAVYAASVDGVRRAAGPAPIDGQGDFVEGPRKVFSGGAGLVGTAGDYGRFAQMLLNDGELDGVRLLSARGVRLMRSNLVGERLAQDLVPQKPGMGFGLGVTVVVDPGAAGMYASAGAFGWSGAWYTNFMVDPEARTVMIVLTQLRPLFDPSLHAVFRTLAYQAIDGPVPETLPSCD